MSVVGSLPSTAAEPSRIVAVAAANAVTVVVVASSACPPVGS